MSPANNKKLENFRQSIDEIDDQLIDLLLKRIEIVEKVGKHKKSSGEDGLFVRSGREGAMLQRIYDAFKETKFNATAAATMWRQLISGSIHHESPLSISVYAPSDNANLFWMAREYCGQCVPMQIASNAGSVVSDVKEDKVNIGVVPYPDADATWWTLISQEHGNYPKIFAHTPAIINEHLPKHISYGLAIGCLAPEPSGNDQSYFSLTLEETVSTSRLHSIFTDAGLEATFLNTTNQAPFKSMLVRLEGFHDMESEAIQSIQATLEDATVFWLGAHPKPIEA